MAEAPKSEARNASGTARRRLSGDGAGRQDSIMDRPKLPKSARIRLASSAAPHLRRDLSLLLPVKK